MFKKYFEKRNKFICPYCGHHFEIENFWVWLFKPHLFDEWRFLKCPLCEIKLWMKREK